VHRDLIPDMDAGLILGVFPHPGLSRVLPRQGLARIVKICRSELSVADVVRCVRRGRRFPC